MTVGAEEKALSPLSPSPCDITLVMAYSEDYTIGAVCERVNRLYAERHGYAFHSTRFRCDDVIPLLQPKLHFTWYKIYLLLQLLEERLLHGPPPSVPAYLFWVDADALVVQPERALEDFLSAGQFKDLIIAEDMHTGCLVNAGVFLVSVSAWSLAFLKEVWAVRRYDTVPFYEQSAITHVLKKGREGLEKLSPFHSYSPGGPQGVKAFPHVAVFPHTVLNSNVGVEEKDLVTASLCAAERLPEVAANLFIYHAAGRKNKLAYLKAALRIFGLQEMMQGVVDVEALDFRLVRTNQGHYRKELVDQLRERQSQREARQQAERKGTQEATVQRKGKEEEEDLSIAQLVDVEGAN